jgi:hypothetical protein
MKHSVLGPSKGTDTVLGHNKPWLPAEADANSFLGIPTQFRLSMLPNIKIKYKLTLEDQHQ